MVEIAPNIGVDDITFGMTEADVQSRLGLCSSSGKNSSGEVYQDWQQFSVRYALDGSGVVEIAINKGVPLSIEGRAIRRDNILDELFRLDPSPVECLGFLLFLEIGVATTGYHDLDPEQESVSVFRRGRWESLREYFEPFSRPGTSSSR